MIALKCWALPGWVRILIANRDISKLSQLNLMGRVWKYLVLTKIKTVVMHILPNIIYGLFIWGGTIVKNSGFTAWVAVSKERVGVWKKTVRTLIRVSRNSFWKNGSKMNPASIDWNKTFWFGYKKNFGPQSFNLFIGLVRWDAPTGLWTNVGFVRWGQFISQQ